MSNFVYELSHELKNNFRLRILGNQKRGRKSQNQVENQGYPVSPLKVNFWQQWSKFIQKQVSNCSSLVQVFLIFLLCGKQLVTYCSLRHSIFKNSSYQVTHAWMFTDRKGTNGFLVCRNCRPVVTNSVTLQSFVKQFS